ncbi:hypothetical protein [Halarsenatibacter silvermanii]|uniref:Uncharacterized protein n=1 Tax=Halarsenatibacter silvermanii TaxID=321763 RepID=A0A1G9TVL2_9FIRM|nr:hypothetical protein [Halarsenatibacter silvermanii]SDM51692.1 hypothetical protein SAMN04488692_1492 [Halarsenatibacter silvermanii]
MKFVVKDRENDEVVWEYMVANESVNHNRLCQEIGVGNVCSRERGQYGVPVGDILEIDDPDRAVEKLEAYLEENSAYDKLEEFEQFLQAEIHGEETDFKER